MGYSGARLYNGMYYRYHAISRSESFEDLDLEKENAYAGLRTFLLFIQRRTSLQINTTWVGRDRIPWRLGAGKEDGKKPIGSSHCIISLRSRLGLFHPLVSDDATCYASMGVCTKTWSICRAHSPRFFRCQTQKYGHLLHIFAPRLFGKIDTVQVLMFCEGKYWHIT